MEALKRQIGPFPLWVWIVAGIGGLGLAYFLNRSILGGGSGGGGGTGDPGSGVGGTPGGWVPAPPVEEQIPGEESVPEPPSILDNEMWAFEATLWLIGQGYNSIIVGIAVRKYLDGEVLSPQEATLIDRVTRAIGPPPNIPVGGGIAEPPAEPPPASKPPASKPPASKPPASKPPASKPKPSSGVFVTVTPWPTKHSTLWGIAETHYKDGTKWTRIWNHSTNAGLRTKRKKPENIRAGDRFFVPK